MTNVTVILLPKQQKSKQIFQILSQLNARHTVKYVTF